MGAFHAGRGGITPSPYSDGLEFPCRPFYFRVPIPWVPGQVALVRQMPFLSDVYTTLHHEMHTLLAQFPPRCEVCLEPGDQLGHVDQSTCPAFQGAPLQTGRASCRERVC